MHENWKEDIPFYITGTLSPERTTELSAHFAQCEGCRRALEEWRIIGAAVQTQAADWGRSLPPLSAQIKQTIQQDLRVVPRTALNPRVRRADAGRNWLLALVASIVTVALFVVLLLTALNTNDDMTADDDAVALALTTEPTATNPPATRTLSVFATVTPVMLTQSAMMPLCEVETTRNVDIIAAPDDSDTVIAQLQPQDRQAVVDYDTRGWLKLQQQGWIAIEHVTLYGECDAILRGVTLEARLQANTIIVSWESISGASLALYAGDIREMTPDNLPSPLQQVDNLPGQGELELLLPPDYAGDSVSVRLLTPSGQVRVEIVAVTA